jgi:indolepyruvate ferredoxin oxidoreductase
LGGIGCHYMVTWMDRDTDTFTHMGGEGVTWSGQAPFTDTPHVFQNLGDGTFFHSGSLAIRQSVATGVNITYKILYNDAVAMTGGQPVDGTLSVPQIAHMMRAEGVQTIVVVSDEIGKWSQPEIFPSGVEFFDRRQLDDVQKRLREVKGVSILIYDQVCATEKRRRRKRGKMADPQKRVMVNTLVCEGCGDCGVKSFCVSVLPKETEFGRKREIDQSNCNKDYSCVNGFCPSFVTVHGGAPRKGGTRDKSGAGAASLFDGLPAPVLKSDLTQPWNILITGVGGTGVVTIGALLGMAGHLEGKGASVLDQTGLAQKGGAVTTHIRIARTPEHIHAVRIAAGEADLVLGCDMVVVNDYWVLSKVRGERSHVVLNTYEAMPGTFTTRPDMQFPASEIVAGVKVALGGRDPMQVDATRLATALMGDAIAANLFMLGYAWQQGLVPISFDAIMRAVELNGAAIEMNKQAFAWGRLAVVDPQAVQEAAGLIHNTQTESERTPRNLQILPPGEWESTEWGANAAPRNPDNESELRGLPEGGAGNGSSVAFLPLDDLRLSRSLDELIARRSGFLSDYQNAGYAKRYTDLVAKVRAAENLRAPASTALTEAVARYFFKLMAYKDEYEVARLYTSGEFQRRLQQQFDGDFKVHFHLAPPLLAKKDAQGRLIKKEYGPWVFTAFKLMAKLRFLRGGVLDIFGYTEERKGERQLIADYEKTVDTLLSSLSADKLPLAVEIASIPEHIRGYGHVKDAHLHKAKAREADLLAKWNNPREIPLARIA